MQKPSVSKADANSAPSVRLDGSKATGLVLLEILLGLFGVWAYWPTLSAIVEAWRSDPHYSHGFLVVPIACAFCWSRWDLRPTKVGRWNGLGICFLALAAAMRIAAARFYLPELDGWSIPLWLAGGICLLRGIDYLRWMLPSLVFLWFATPLPASLEVSLSSPLQHLAATWSSTVLQLFGHMATPEGTTIVMGDHVLDIERACSGLRMFYGIFALAFACVVFARVRGWEMLMVLFAAVPVALVANVLRIVVTGMLLERVSSEAASRFSHDFAGLLMIPFAVGLFILILAWLNQTARKFSRHPAVGWSWLTKWGIALLLLLAGLFLWSQRQSDLAVDQLLELAERYESEQQWDAAKGYLWQYLQARPDDREVAQRYALLGVRTAADRREAARSVHLLMNAWRKDTEQVELAFTAAQASLEWNDTKGALEICDELESLVSQPEPSARVKQLRVEAMLTNLSQAEPPYVFTWEELAAALQAALEWDGKNVVYAAELAETWQARLAKPDEAQRAERALGVLERLIEANPQNPLAWLARYEFLQRHYSAVDAEQQAVADSDLIQALKNADHADAAGRGEIYLLVALDAQQSGEFKKAEAFFRQAITQLPEDSRAYVALAELKRSTEADGGSESAKQVLREGLDRMGAATPELLLPLASLHLQTGDWQAAQLVLNQVESQLPGNTAAGAARLLLGAGLLRSQLILHEAGPYRAISFLESVLADPQIHAKRLGLSQLFIDAHLLLAGLYREANVADRASENYGLAMQLGETSEPVLSEAITAALEAGDLESAELRAAELLRQEANSPEALVALVDIKLQRQMRLAPRDQDLGPAARALEKARRLGVPDAMLLLSEVGLLKAKGDLERAERLLVSASEQLPDEPAIWRALADLYDSQGQLERALEAAETYGRLNQQSLAPIVLKVRLLEKLQRGEEARQLLRLLLEDRTAEHWSKAATQLAGLQVLLGDVQQGTEVLQLIVEQQPDNFAALDQLAQLAWAKQDLESLQSYEQLLRDAEGEAGTLWRYHRAQRLLDESVSQADEGYSEVLRISQYLRERRPRWSRTSLLLGELALRSGQDQAAVNHFERAWSLGERSVLLIDRLLELLAEQGRTSEALAYMSQVRSSLALSVRLFERAWPLLIEAGEGEQAVALAEYWIEREPDEAEAYLRLGKILLARAAAEGALSATVQSQIDEAFQTAVRLDPSNVDVWVFNLLSELPEEATPDQIDRRLTTLAEHIHAEHIQVEASEKAYVLAQVNEALGRPLAAHEFYERAISMEEASASDLERVQRLERAAEFYVGRADFVAETCLRRALELDPNAVVARRLLLELLLQRSDPHTLSEAEQLLSGTDSQGVHPLSEFDLRQRAKLLQLRDDSESLAEAIRVRESLFNPNADDRRKLAEMYEKLGRLDPAFEALRDLVDSSEARPQDLLALLDFWARHFAVPNRGGESPKFASFAKRVEEQLLVANASQTDWLRWRITRSLVEAGESPVECAVVRSQVSRMREANKDFEQWIEEDQLAWCRDVLQVLVEANLTGCAMEFVDQPPAELSKPDVAIAFCHAMILAPVSSDFAAEANRFLLAIQQASPLRSDLARAIGDSQFMSAQYPLAVESYRRALAIDPADQFARNNLALALAELPGELEVAQEVLGIALSEAGDDPMFLDTLAVLQLAGGNAEAALQSLERVLEVNPENASARIHRAMAYELSGNQQLMVREIVSALVLGVDDRLLSPRDRTFFHQVVEQQRQRAETFVAADSKSRN